MDPGVRIHPLDLHDLALQPDRRVWIELSAKRMMAGHGDSGGQQTKSRNENA
jgi:hypothetical protein